MLKLAIIEDSELLRTGLRAVLEANGLVEVVGEFGLEEAAVSEVERLSPDVVLLGMRRPDLNRTAVICRLLRKRESSMTKVVMVSPETCEEEALAAVLSGASGYVSMDVPESELVHAVRMAVNGGAHFEKDIADRMIGWLGQSPHPVSEDSPRVDGLTAREEEILSMVALGQTNREIAQGLGIATVTVRNNLTRIRSKLGVESRTKLVRYAYEHGLTRFGDADLVTPVT